MLSMQQMFQQFRGISFHLFHVMNPAVTALVFVVVVLCTALAVRVGGGGGGLHLV